MRETQESMLLRQIELNACQMRERQMAMSIARSRELFQWQAAMAGVVSPLLMLRASKGNPAFLAPLIPICFVLGYSYDMCYGSKMDRIRTEAERILSTPEDHDRFVLLPLGEPTIAAIDENIRAKALIATRAAAAAAK